APGSTTGTSDGPPPDQGPVAQVPPGSSDSSPGTGAIVPGGTTGAMPPNPGCGASATGGAPLLAGAALALAALLGRRKLAPALARRSQRR
ncbi:MAG: MYXO-CTERM sorting domain-containing protein, partial [Archangium sp.]